MMSYYILISFILFLGSFALGTAGFGFALVSVPLLSIVVSPKFAVPFVLVYGYGTNFFLLLRFKEYINWQKAWPMIMGALPGIPVGIYTLKYTEDMVIKKIVGGAVIIFVLWNLFVRTERSYTVSRFWGLLAGFASGILSGACGISGPPVVMYVTLNRWEKNLTRATLQFFFFVMGTGTLFGLIIEKVLTLQVLRFNLLYFPVVILGGVTGYLFFKRTSPRIFNGILLCLLLAIGLFLVSS